MSTIAKERRGSETLNIRIQRELRELIDRAASVTGTTRACFVREAARQAAREALLDQTLFMVTPKQFAKYERLFHRPGRPNARLRETMKRSLPWANES